MNEFHYFSSPIYKTNTLEYLDVVKQVAEEKIINSRLQGVDEIYPSTMSENLIGDARIAEFYTFICQQAWNALASQGYDMNQFETYASSIWMQEHNKFSSMEQHVHKDCQIVGFYFLEVPENGSKAVFYDPKPGKVMMGLPEKNRDIATSASDVINFECQPGDLILTNAWLPHSFTRNRSDKPVRFIHFNIYAKPVEVCQAEVI